MFDLPWGDLIPFAVFGVVVADASVAIRGDMSGFHKDLKGAETATVGLGGKLKQIFSPRNLALGVGALGIGLGIRNLVGYAGDAAEAFSQLQQTQRTVDEVFGKSASVIEDWAERSADAAGMSQQTVFQSASVMGQTLINMGFAADEAAEKTVMLQQRAAEMAIAFGQTPERAILAITAAMRGERDTIEKFGVSIKQVDVNSKVAALGLDTSTAAAKKNAEAMAILELVMEQTEAQSGRFADSQDDVAVKMAQAKAKIDDFMATQVGPMFASIQLGAIKVAEGVGGAAEDVGMFFDNIFNEEKAAKVQAMADRHSLTFNEMKNKIQEAATASGRTWEDQLDEMVHGSERRWEDMQGVYSLALSGLENLTDGHEADNEDSWERIASTPTEALRDEYNAIRIAAYQSMVEYAKGVMEGQNEPQVAFDAAMQLVEEEMTKAEEVANLEGKLMTLQHAAGVAAAEGKVASVNAINATIDLIVARMEYLTGQAYGHGTNLALTYAAGIVNNLGVVRDAGRQLAQGVASQARIESEPPDHSSPLYGITKWGGNIVKTIAAGITGELGTGTSAAAALAGSLVPSIGASGAASAGGSINGAAVKNYNLTVHGKEPVVSSAQEILREMTRLESFDRG